MMSQYTKTPFIICLLDPAISVTLGAGMNQSPTVLSALQRLHMSGHLPANASLYSKKQILKFVPQVLSKAFYWKTKFVRFRHNIYYETSLNLNPWIYLIWWWGLWTGIEKRGEVTRVCKAYAGLGRVLIAWVWSRKVHSKSSSNELCRNRRVRYTID